VVGAKKAPNDCYSSFSLINDALGHCDANLAASYSQLSAAETTPLATERVDQASALGDTLRERESHLSPLLNAHSLTFSVSSSARSASALIFTALATISCAALSASARISRAVACASAMRRSPSACARASTSAATKTCAVDRSSIRFVVHPHLVCGALLEGRTTKTSPPFTAGILSTNSTHSQGCRLSASCMPDSLP
jgi:hypothetical protein